MPYFEFLWTDEILKHLAEHGIGQDEFEDVACDPDETDVSHSSGREIAFGWTTDGRYIVAIYEHLDELMILPVTAYEVPEPGSAP
jgi:hypothetical protein